ncbi:Arylsulfatase K [Labeo rohita]|uniref:Arylsulfatase K n=1 Tax=Labeo rohita TaxID=84645 RepID=A0ABQ8MPU9_LABRO|nr:Arylsulfatase K [Labeo rohita]
MLQMNARCMYLNWTSHDRPNIVMIMSDAFLPYINYMRETGAAFLNSYTNSPICCPSRAAMWSGQFVHLTQAWNNYKCLDPNATTWMDRLGKSGNRVEAWTRDVPFLLRQEGRPVTDLVGDTSTKRVMIKDWNITDAAVQWIRHTAASLAQPFGLYVGLNLPHPYRTDSLGPTAGVSVPKWLRVEDMHPVDYYSTFTKNCSDHFTEEEIRNIRAFYYAMCAETDSMLGEVIAALRETGLLNRTVILFTSDHGDLAMEHRQFYKMSMFEGSSHVPLLIMGPGVKPGFEISLPVSLVDIYPTVLDLAGVPQPGGLSGHSLIPLLSGVSVQSVEPHPGWVLSEYHGCNANASTYMLRIGEWKYITYADGLTVPSQLFNLSKDESELRNVASHFPHVCQDLDKMLRTIVDYPSISQAVHHYNKQQFLEWKQSLGDSYSQVIANLRWHIDWQKDAKSYERDIEEWLSGSD